MSAATITPTKPVRAARQVAPKAGNVCIVHVGAHLSVAMPLESGLQLVRIMAGAMVVENKFNARSEEYFESNQIGETVLVVIKADQIIPRVAKPAPKESGVKP